MAVYALGDVVPDVAPDAFVHPAATVIGDVSVGSEATVWPGAVLRGDYGKITVGPRTSIQDGSVLHAGPGFPTIIGSDCVVGHLVHLEGCTLEDGCLVGSGAIVLHHAVVGEGATVGAGAVVLANTNVAPGALAVGIPARVKAGISHLEVIRVACEEYVQNGRFYRREMRRIDRD